MKMYCMWHPTLKWGAVRPTLFEHKLEAVRGTGITLAKMRELGWRWIEVEVVIPDTYELCACGLETWVRCIQIGCPDAKKSRAGRTTPQE